MLRVLMRRNGSVWNEALLPRWMSSQVSVGVPTKDVDPVVSMDVKGGAEEDEAVSASETALESETKKEGDGGGLEVDATSRRNSSPRLRLSLNEKMQKFRKLPKLDLRTEEDFNEAKARKKLMRKRKHRLDKLRAEHLPYDLTVAHDVNDAIGYAIMSPRKFDQTLRVGNPLARQRRRAVHIGI